MTDKTYNGWANRATWLVNCWFEPETRDDVRRARDIIEEQYDAMPAGVLKDMIDLRDIDWDELLASIEDEDGTEDSEEEL